MSDDADDDDVCVECGRSGARPVEPAPTLPLAAIVFFHVCELFLVGHWVFWNRACVFCLKTRTQAEEEAAIATFARWNKPPA